MARDQPADFPPALKIITVWLVLGALLFLGIGYVLEQRTRAVIAGLPDGTTELRLPRGRDGHYRIEAVIQGERIVMLVDTGATRTSIPASVADRLTLPVVGQERFMTANGSLTAPIVTGTMTLAGHYRLENQRFAAMPAMHDAGLLGMDVLGKLRLEQVAGELRLRLP